MHFDSFFFLLIDIFSEVLSVLFEATIGARHVLKRQSVMDIVVKKVRKAHLSLCYRRWDEAFHASEYSVLINQ